MVVTQMLSAAKAGGRRYTTQTDHRLQAWLFNLNFGSQLSLSF